MSLILNKVSQVSTGPDKYIIIKGVKSTSTKTPLSLVDYIGNPIITGEDSPPPYINPNTYSPDVHWNPKKQLYEMFYGGWDRTLLRNANDGGLDHIYLAESPDALNWTKKKITIATSNKWEYGLFWDDSNYEEYWDWNWVPYGPDSTHANDPTVIDCPAWNKRVMLYTGNNGDTADYDSICLAYSDIYCDDFRKIGKSFVPIQGKVRHSRPAAIWDVDRIKFWWDYGDYSSASPYNQGYGEILFDGSNFIYQAYPSNPVIAFDDGPLADIDAKKVGNDYYLIGRPVNRPGRLYKSPDGINFTPAGDYITSFALDQNAGNYVTPMLFLDPTSGIPRAIYHGRCPTGDWTQFKIEMMMVVKGVKFSSVSGATCRAIDFDTIRIDFPAGTSLPLSDTVTIYNEDMTPLTILQMSNINNGDVYQLNDSSSFIVDNLISLSDKDGLLFLQSPDVPYLVPDDATSTTLIQSIALNWPYVLTPNNSLSSSSLNTILLTQGVSSIFEINSCLSTASIGDINISQTLELLTSNLMSNSLMGSIALNPSAFTIAGMLSDGTLNVIQLSNSSFAISGLVSNTGVDQLTMSVTPILYISSCDTNTDIENIKLVEDITAEIDQLSCVSFIDTISISINNITNIYSINGGKINLKDIYGKDIELKMFLDGTWTTI